MILFILPILSIGCVTEYKGSGPNLDLKGAQAEDEIKKFSLEEAYWSQGPFLRYSEEKTAYTIESVSPFIKKVSPEASRKIETVMVWRQAQLITLGIGIVGLVAGLSATDASTQNSFYNLSLLGSCSSIAVGFVWPGMLASAASQYNQDLRKGFTPSLGMNFNF